MNNKEHKEYLEAFKRYSKKIASTKKEAGEFLVRAGIYNKKGKLSKAYTS